MTATAKGGGNKNQQQWRHSALAMASDDDSNSNNEKSRPGATLATMTAIATVRWTRRRVKCLRRLKMTAIMLVTMTVR